MKTAARLNCRKSNAPSAQLLRLPFVLSRTTMRYYILLLLLLPVAVQAQQKPTMHLGFNTGIIFNQSNFIGNDISAVTYNSDNVNIWLGMKSWLEYEHMQIGMAVESGIVNENIEYTLRQYENHALVNESIVFTRFRMVSPAVMPMLFAHYKMNLPRNTRMYAGPAVGMLAGYNQYAGHNIWLLAGGLNLGISFAISRHARFEVAHAWRMTKVDIKKDVAYQVPPDGNGNYSQYSIPDFWLQIFTNSIGIVVDF